jgi:hypothetical protein
MHDTWAKVLGLCWRGTLHPADGSPPLVPHMTAAPGYLTELCRRLVEALLDRLGLGNPSEVARRARVRPSTVNRLGSASVWTYDRIASSLHHTWHMGVVPARDPNSVAGVVAHTPDEVSAALRRIYEIAGRKSQ